MDAAATTARAGLLRERFPALRREVGGRPLVYLDTAATAQKPEAVIEAEARFYRVSNANVHRGLHTLAEEATAAYEACRARVAAWIGAARPADVVITRNATAALNLAARGWEQFLQPGDEVLLTEMEHHANLVPWLMLARRRGVTVRYLPLTPDGRLDLSQLPALLGPRTKVVALTAVSNVLGTINPVAEIADAARRRGALVVVDAAQAVGHLPLDFAALGADLLAFSAHKVYGPMGLGFLVGRPEVLARLEPVEGGGEMIERVEWDAVTWADVPLRFEAGTPNVAAAAAFPPALDLLDELGPDRVRRHERDLTGYAWERLAGVPGLRLFGPADPDLRGSLVSFHDPQVHPHDMATLLDQRGIAVRAGHHCAQPLHRRLGVVATTRASFGLYTSHDEVDALIDGIAFARSVFA
ncbi:MAG: aminotransferase class V-fold PLP-dependent enzyme [Candidatus Krumholzibacteriia bacterium]